MPSTIIIPSQPQRQHGALIRRSGRL